MCACRALTRSGISVHAYLMYGFPTETEQEMIDSLERVRQLYQLGYIQFANWQCFVLTIHSPMARDPDRYGIRPSLPFRPRSAVENENIGTSPGSDSLVAKPRDGLLRHSPKGGFARYGIHHDDSEACGDLGLFETGLERVNNYLIPTRGNIGTPGAATWRPAGADWADRPRHGFRAPDWIVIDPDAQDLVLFDVN